MPVDKSRDGMQDLSLDQAKSTLFLPDDEKGHVSDLKSFLQVNATDDDFPFIVCHKLPEFSAALDRASPSERLPINGVQQITGQHGASTNGSSISKYPISLRPAYRHPADAQQDRQIRPPTEHIQAIPPAPHSTHLTSDFPAIKTISNGMGNITTIPNSHAQQQFHNRKASLGRIPQKPIDRQSRALLPRDPTATNWLANLPLESLGGKIYALCKNQHGCRYLQKKLEERNPEHVHMIWLETHQHVIELMTDPFGNYLCQKLLEFCSDEERPVLIENAARDLARIALNQHGTRALQKMIEFISTPSQIRTIIAALRYQVVELIQDLNGNHVIQKCLNKLSPTDAQFIFDAAITHCVDIGTHRHGCCVLQRCIDHASGKQKAWLIRQISNNAVTLVQDPFGNYVVQHILDLNDSMYTEPLVAMFQGRVGQLSRQKFSSNVIEKCLRCALEPSKDMLIEEMLQPTELDKLIRDSFANYVIQTALDSANPSMRARLTEAIRPFLPAIRATPCGRRIQAKIWGSECRSGSSSKPPRRMHQRTLSNAPPTSSITPPNRYSNSCGPGPLPSIRPTATAFPSINAQQPYVHKYARGGSQTGAGNHF